MKGDSRVQKSLLNAKINTVCFFVSLVLSFFSRKIFLNQFGAAFMGLSSTLYSILGFLNIAELGIGVAISYTLYKPVAESDQSKINEIVSVLGYLYRCIGHFILLAGILFSIFLPIIFAGEDFGLGVIYTGYFAYLFSSLIGYYINYRQILLSADQRNYEVTGYYQIIGVFIMLSQMLAALYTQNFYIFFGLQLVSGILYSLLLNYRINIVYPWLDTEVREGKKLLKEYSDITKLIKQIFVHKIAGFVQFQLTPFLVYAFVSLPMVAIYANYTIVSEKLSKLIQGVLDSTTASVGNLISEGDKTKVWCIYKQLLAFRMFLSGICCSCFFYLIDGFINLWVGDIFLLPPSSSCLLTISLFLFLARGTTDQFLNGYGLYYDIWAPVAESIIFLGSSIVLGIFYGLNGLLMGPILSMLIIVHIWKPYFLFSKGFKKGLSHYVKLLTIYIPSIIVSYKICISLISLLDMNMSSWDVWLLNSILFLISYSFTLAVLFFLLSKDFRLLLKENRHRLLGKI